VETGEGKEAAFQFSWKRCRFEMTGISIDLQTRTFFILEKSLYVDAVVKQQAQHIPLGLVTALEPDDLRRIAIDQTELVEIRILGNDGEAVVLGVSPDAEIVSLVETDNLDLCRTWVDGFQLLQ
jgi:hypothetical protein